MVSVQGVHSGRFSARKVLRTARIVVLAALLAASALLNYWSHQGDPRFFRFLSSPVGREVAHWFGWWRSPLEVPVPDKSEHAYSRRERNIKEAIEHVLDEKADADPAYAQSATYEVRYRDIQFRQEFADLPLYLYPPYAIITDLPAPEVDRTMAALRDIHDEFNRTFAPLTSRRPKHELIHLLYFSDKSAYRGYVRQHDQDLENSSGFYSPTVNRLVLFHQDHGVVEDSEIDPVTLLTVRHESAHQLLFTLGVHSQHRIENEWLMEGLASYCETPELGGIDPLQANLLQYQRQRGRLIPIRDLVNHRSDRGLLAYKPAQLAYGESWSLVHFLMQDAYRKDFFAYIRYLRDTDSFQAVRREERFLTLCRHLGLSPGELEREWMTHVQSL